MNVNDEWGRTNKGLFSSIAGMDTSVKVWIGKTRWNAVLDVRHCAVFCRWWSTRAAKAVREG